MLRKIGVWCIFIVVLSQLIALTAQAQSTYPIRTDTLRVYSGGTGATLKLESATRNVLGPLMNIGGGITEYRLLTQADIPTLDFSKVAGLQAALNAKINVSEKGAVNGVATLGPDGKVPASQLPPAVATNLQASTDAGNTTTNMMLVTGAGNPPSSGSGLLLGMITGDNRAIVSALNLSNPAANPSLQLTGSRFQLNGTAAGEVSEITGAQVGISATDLLELSSTGPMHFITPTGTAARFQDAAATLANVKGAPATAADEFITRAQMTDSLNARGGGGGALTWGQTMNNGNVSTRRAIIDDDVNNLRLDIGTTDGDLGATDLRSFNGDGSAYRPFAIGAAGVTISALNGLRLPGDGINALIVGGTTKGLPATQGDQYITRQQMTDSLNARGSGGGGGTNIYNSDGALSGARVVNGAGNSLSFTNTSTFGVVSSTVNVTSTGATTVGASAINLNARTMVNGATDDGSSGLQVAGVAKASRFVATAASGLQLLNTDGYIEAYNSAGTQQHGYLQWSGASSTTGLYNVLAWPLVFGNSGTERMRIHSNGFVGINTANVYNPISLPNDKYIGWNNVGGTTDNAGIKANATDDLVFFSGGERMLIQAATGNVGIGTSNPQSQVSIFNELEVGIELQPGSPNVLRSINRNSGDHSQMAYRAVEHLFQSGTNASQDALYIGTNGNVAVGFSTNPTERLHVAGNIIGNSLRSPGGIALGLYSNGTQRVSMPTTAGFKTHTAVAGNTRTVSTAAPYVVSVDDHIILMYGMGTGEGDGVVITLPDPSLAINNGRELIFIEQSASTWTSDQLLYTAMASTQQINGMTTIRCIGGRWFITAKITSSFP